MFLHRGGTSTANGVVCGDWECLCHDLARPRGHRWTRVPLDTIIGWLGMKPASYVNTNLPLDVRVHWIWIDHRTDPINLCLMLSSADWEGPPNGEQAPEIPVVLYHDPRILEDLRSRFVNAGNLIGPTVGDR